MKKIYTLIAFSLCFVVTTNAQENNTEFEPNKKIQCKWFFKTPELRDLIPYADVVPDGYYDNQKAKDKREDYVRWWADEANDIGIPENNDVDPALQDKDGWRDGSEMIKANWQGLGGALPPDPSGAAGINNYVQATNSSYRVFDKDGIPQSPPLFLHTLWTGSSSDGDPIVMYDRYADRWFISQFQVNSDEILIAVSETSDPMGAYYTYDFSFGAFPDYPKFGVWSNAYIMTLNTSTTDCVVFERDKMLTGDPGAAMYGMYFPNLTMQFPSLAPSYAEGLWPPDSNSNAWAFAVQDNFLPGISQDHISIMKIIIDWDNVGNMDVYEHQELPTSAFDGYFSTNWQDLNQPGSTNNIDAISGIFMYKAQFRRFDGYDVIMLTHTVDVGGNRAGVRWYELRMDNGSDQWYIHQESTFDPADNSHRWMGNCAMDLNGNIGLAYSYMGNNSGEYAGLRYTGRFDGDALNTMTVQEQVAVVGEGAQDPGWGDPQTDARYGDYSQMTVDPVDDATFWFTGEYLGPGGARRTRIFSFAMWELLGTEKPDPTPYFNSYQPSPNEMTVMWNDLKDNKFDIILTDLSGKIIAQEINVDASLGQKTFDLPANATGIYIVTLRGENTEMSDKIWFAK